MSDAPLIVIRLDGDNRHRQPGQTLSGQYWIESLDPSQVKAVEASVLWYTEGKGDEDMAVHEFWRRDASDAPSAGRPPARAVLHHAPQQPAELSGTAHQDPLVCSRDVFTIAARTWWAKGRFNSAMLPMGSG